MGRRENRACPLPRAWPHMRVRPPARALLSRAARCGRQSKPQTAGVADCEAGAGFLTGVMITLVTSPLTASFCFLLVVPRAVRVALNFAVAAAFCSLVNGVRAWEVATEVSELLWRVAERGVVELQSGPE